MYDLEDRTLNLAIKVRNFVKSLPNSIAVNEDIRQLVRSSGSIGANYIEANESLSRKDFLLRIRISRKEAKEAVYWLKIINHTASLDNSQLHTCNALIQEALEIKKILSAIINKSV
jgi:four helix bundle protein